MATKRKSAVDAAPKSEEVVVACKGFDKDFKCRGYQFEVGKDGIRPDTWYRAHGGKLVEVE